MKRVVIIDNYDSFTYILRQYFGEIKGNPQVFYNDQITLRELRRLNPTHLVLSPGPGTVENPHDVGITFEVIREFYKTTPILGVCLGHQALGKFFGGTIASAPKVMHGKRSQIHHKHEGIFKGLPSPLEVMRYHSLLVKNPDLKITAQTDDGLIMALEHEKHPVFGVQFHPESLGTRYGKKLLRNFLSL